MGTFSNCSICLAASKWLPHLPEASKCPFAATNLNDHHPIMLVLVWQTIFVFKNTKDHKNVKNLSIKSFITGRNRKNQGRKKEIKATPFVILAFLVYTFNINAMC